MIIDLHCDTIKTAYQQNINLKNKELQFNLKSVENIMPYIQVLATFIDVDEQNKGFEVATNIINNFYKNLYDTRKMYLINNINDIVTNLSSNKLGVILSIENGSAISGKIENIDKLYDKGIKIMSIVWNEDNELASGAHTKNDTGLTALGKEYIKKLVNKKILIDVSHSSNKTFWDTIKIVKDKPIIATHSNCKKICNNSRNLDDEQIKQIASLGGVIGITYVNDFLRETGIATSYDVACHIDYITNLVGIDYVSLGSDFDGVHDEQKPRDIKGVIDVKNIIHQLIKMGYSDEDIEKITNKNFIRVLCSCLDMKK